MLDMAQALRVSSVSHGTRLHCAPCTPHPAQSLKPASNPSKLRAQVRGLAGVQLRGWGWRTTGQLSRRTRALLTSRDPGSGAEFPLVQTLWHGDLMRCLGVHSISRPKLIFFKSHLYAIAFLVEPEKAARELGIRARGGFFETDDDYCAALIDGGFTKALQFLILSDVSVEDFLAPLTDLLRPRLLISGGLDNLEHLETYLRSSDKFGPGAVLTLLYRKDGKMEVVLSESFLNLDTIVPVSLHSVTFSRALFEAYLGEASVAPEAKEGWIAGARELLDSDKERRSSRRGGAG